jgi:hypothetical protein
MIDWENKHQILKNPKTDAYCKFKSFVLSNDFPWFYYPRVYDTTWDFHLKGVVPEDKIRAFNYEDVPFFSHNFLCRPMSETKYPTVNSNHLKMAEKVINEILDYNKITVNCFFRINANLVLPMKGHKKTIPHIDHYWKHNIFFMYLTDAGGETVCVDKNLNEKLIFNPKEDSLMLLKATDTLHYHYLAEKKRRVIIQASHI